MFGHEIWPVGSDQGAWRGRDLYLWAGDDVCFSESARGGIPQLSESDKCTRRDGVELVQTRGAEGTNERHGAPREVKDPKLVVFNFRGQLQCRTGGNVKVPLKLTPSSGI